MERKRGSGSKQVYDLLRNEILDLVLPPGSAIDEVSLAARFEVSRTPIREALVRLASEGLVTTLPNRSSMVSTIDYLNLHTFFDALVLMYRVTTRLAATHHEAADLATIRARQTVFRQAVEAQNALAMIATNQAFHLAISQAGRNPYFHGLFSRLMDDGRRILRIYYNSYQDRLPQRFVDEHEAMIAAIEARDLETCDRLAKRHGEQIVDQIRTLLARGGELDITL
ncbi:GntR family transcriptional regulator [Fulvimarina sp. 2208YS6-2-32]|uniref:GntR family transcriptional regulator n=1 Tax=Fulvimarina uroteuthidis TaxID=3098149 RepID=A0ABU5HYY3_9HYPH|nr:GntR family transcriptional regulator [Fulvimarina sp. 2208YS6-2-32]MDY8108330.1 GntR family transcriptional regulator [Fulvimarina sp. 2208YS6-2-32]